jgi:archaea-specific RecJ-like exonuclease
METKENNKEKNKEYKKRDNNRFNDNNKEYSFERKEAIRELHLLNDGDYFKGTVKILRKAKPGPVVFSVTDGTKIVDAVTKDSDFNSDEVVYLRGKASKRQDTLQIEIDEIKVSDADFSKIIDEKSNPTNTKFSMESKRYEKLRPKFIEIAKRLRKAIFEGQPILIRHHCDADGITAGIIIEKALTNQMKKTGVNPEYVLYRSPSKAPFYEATDMFRDLELGERLKGFGQKIPLIMVIDNGSTPEDSFSLKTLQILGYECIVVDHHNPVVFVNDELKTSVCDYLSYHLNPYMAGYDSKTCAAMLCYELARFIDEDFNNPVMPAVAAIADRCDIEEANKYIEESKLTKEELTKIGIAIDFTAYHLRFDSGRGIYEEIYKNKDFVNALNIQVKKGVETQLQSTLPHVKTQEIEGVIFSHIDLEKYTLRFTYPTAGKVTGMIHDVIAVGKEHIPVITIGHTSDMIILRATKPVLPIDNIIKHLQKILPQANVDGGGHECAGTIKFVSAHLDTIVAFIKEQIRNLHYMEIKQ